MGWGTFADEAGSSPAEQRRRHENASGNGLARCFLAGNGFRLWAGAEGERKGGRLETALGEERKLSLECIGGSATPCTFQMEGMVEGECAMNSGNETDILSCAAIGRRYLAIAAFVVASQNARIRVAVDKSVARHNEISGSERQKICRHHVES